MFVSWCSVMFTSNPVVHAWNGSACLASSGTALGSYSLLKSGAAVMSSSAANSGDAGKRKESMYQQQGERTATRVAAARLLWSCFKKIQECLSFVADGAFPVLLMPNPELGSSTQLFGLTRRIIIGFTLCLQGPETRSSSSSNNERLQCRRLGLHLASLSQT